MVGPPDIPLVCQGEANNLFLSHHCVRLASTSVMRSLAVMSPYYLLRSGLAISSTRVGSTMKLTCPAAEPTLILQCHDTLTSISGRGRIKCSEWLGRPIFR